MQEKQTASRQLTPVAGEAQAAQVAQAARPDTGASFPYDRLDVIEQALSNIEREIGFVREGLGLIKQQSQPVSLNAARKEKAERFSTSEASAKFDADLAAKQEAAQAAVFKAPDGSFADLDGWVCPTHGKVIGKVSNKSGRKYRGCPDCNLFEPR